MRLAEPTYDSTSTFELPALLPVHRYWMAGLALLGGISVGLGTWWVAAGCVALIVLLLSLSHPEAVIVLFLTAGIYKQDPRVAGLVPFDLTVALGVLLAIGLVPRCRKTWIPPQGVLLVPLFATVGWGILSPATAYGAEKAMRFCTLTALVTLASIVVIDSPKSLRRFLVVLACLGFVVSVDALRHQDSGGWDRLTFSGSNPIPLGRVGAIAFAFGWVRFHFARSRLERLAMLAVLGFAASCTLASGSRGPALSVVASLGLISVVTYSTHRRMPLAIGPLVLFTALGAILVGLASGPVVPWHRFEILLSEDKGASILMRGYIFALAWNLTLGNPLGIGIGGFERHAPMHILYPHNLFLEVGCELGWIVLICLVLFLAWSISTMVRILRREYAWHTLFLGMVFLSALMNSMVSGDLNDNRLLYATFLLPFTYRRMQESQASIAGAPGRNRALGRNPTLRHGDSGR